mgnify:CR=1 FL=1
MTRRFGLAAVPAALCAGAMGQTTTLTVDSAQSQMDLSLTLNISLLGSATSGDSSPISGTLEVELDDYALPTAFTIHDFDLALSDDLAFNFSLFLTDVNATASSLGATYANPGVPVGPVPLSGGMFAFASVPTALTGSVVATGDVFGVGAINETIDLSAQEPFEAPADGIIPGVATMDVAGTVTFVASGPAPAPGGCNAADLAEPFNVLDFSDVVAFLTAFGAMDPGADLAPPTGVFDFSDVVAFLGAFGSGCP